MTDRKLMARRRVIALCALCLAASDLALGQVVGSSRPPSLPAGGCFEWNMGQTDSRVRGLARSRSGFLFVTDDGATLSLSDGERRAALKMRLLDRDPGVCARGVGRLPGVVHYFHGRDPSGWIRDVPTFARLRLDGIHPGVDVIFRSGIHAFEYDLLLDAGVDASEIRIEIEGAESMRWDDDSTLRITTVAGEVVHRPPTVHQESGGVRRELPARCVPLGGGRFTFEVEGADGAYPLLIDPVVSYASLLGGGQMDRANAISVDGSRQAVIAGATFSPDFPSGAGPFGTFGGLSDAFVAKFAGDGGGRLWSTYISGALHRREEAFVRGPGGRRRGARHRIHRGRGVPRLRKPRPGGARPEHRRVRPPPLGERL